MPDDEVPDHLVPARAGRGFARYPELVCTYLSKIEVGESSRADAPHLWLRISSVDDINAALIAHNAGDPDPDVPRTEASAHITLAMAEQLREQLQAAIEGHYQLQEPT